MAIQKIKVKVLCDPVLLSIMDEISKCPKFGEIAKSLAKSDNATIGQIADGAVCVYPSDELLEEYYKHKEKK